jgi:N-acetyl-anhydromuramyl-L-alanine amidase AmpD
LAEMRKTSKKGAVVLFFTVIVIILLMGIILLVMANRTPTIKYVGNTQLTLFNAFEFTENTFAYMDMAVEIAVNRASRRIAAEGGQSRLVFEHQKEEYSCGQVVYPLLNDETGVSDCLSFKEEEFERVFRSEFSSLLAKYDKVDLAEYEYKVNVELLPGGQIKTEVIFVSPINFPIYTYTSSYHEAGSSTNWLRMPSTETYTENEHGYLERRGLEYGSRNNREIDAVVMHYTVGTSIDGTYQALKEQGFSYHYIIDKDGKIYQFVPEDKAAWHAGGCEERTQNQYCRSRYEQCITCIPGYNSRSIGVSFVSCGYDHPGCGVEACYMDTKISGKCWDPFTDEQFRSAARLIAEISVRNPGFIISNEAITSHSDIAADKSDPGPGFDLRREEFIRMANQHYHEITTT